MGNEKKEALNVYQEIIDIELLDDYILMLKEYIKSTYKLEPKYVTIDKDFYDFLCEKYEKQLAKRTYITITTNKVKPFPIKQFWE